MKILAIETSCDETAISIVEATDSGTTTSVTVLGDALYSQATLHAKYGGVYPNLARREHTKNATPLLMKALKEAGLLTPSDTLPFTQEAIGVAKQILTREPALFAQLMVTLGQIETPKLDAIAVTHGPGLEPALWVGINFAKALSILWDISLVPVNHMEGHIISSVLEETRTEVLTIPDVPFPAIALLVSGGHTELVLVDGWGQYQLLGTTRDDAVGEAFDKVARMLELPYPGGPEISKLAERARKRNLPTDISLPRPMIGSDDLDFSFSGLKTAVLYLVREHGTLDDDLKQKIAREFEDASVSVLVSKTLRAVTEYSARSIIIGGGVTANKHLRETLTKEVDSIDDVELYIPRLSLTTDNAIMIAVVGYLFAKDKQFAKADDIVANGNLSLSSE